MHLLADALLLLAPLAGLFTLLGLLSLAFETEPLPARRRTPAAPAPAHPGRRRRPRQSAWPRAARVRRPAR